MALMFLTRKRNKRSNVPLSHTAPTTLGVGSVVPLSMTRVIAGDEISFQPSAFVQAMPMAAPLVNGFKICFEYFFVPDRLYNVHLNLNEKDYTDDPDSVTYPRMTLPNKNEFVSTLESFSGTIQHFHDENLVVQPGSLADYLGFPVGFFPSYANDEDATFGILRVLGYLDIYYNYYLNAQIPYFPTAEYIHTMNYSGIDPETMLPENVKNGYVNWKINNPDLRSLLQHAKTADDPMSFWQNWIIDNAIDGDFNVDNQDPSILLSWAWLCSKRSIFQRCMPDYYLESWLNTSGYNSAEIKVDLEADGRTVSMRNISTMSHIQRWLDLALGDGSYSSYLDNQFDVSSVKNSSVPLFLGADKMDLGSRIIYQTTGFESDSSPLGSFAGQASNGNEFRNRNYKFGEHGYFVVMASVVPDVIYTRGLDIFLREKTLADVYVPALDNIAMEPLKVEQLESCPSVVSSTVSNKVDPADNEAYSPANPPVVRIGVGNLSQAVDLSVGFIPAWSKVTQNVSRAHGLLTTSLKYWLLGREYDFTAITDQYNKDEIREQLDLADRAGFISENQKRGLLAFLENSYTNKYITPYIEAHRYNDVFADNSPYAENFVLVFSCNMVANREKSKANVATTL